MSIKLRILLIMIIILLAGCNYPQAEPKLLPIDSEKPPTEISTTAPPLQVTDTPQPDSTNGSPAPDSPPIEPTKDMTQVLAGDLIPIFPAGTDIIIHEIHMVNNLAGWAIAVEDPEIEHVLRTEDGGNTWQDVTPPQPLVTGDPGFTTVDLGIWDVNTAWVNYAGSDLIWTTTNGGVNWDVVPVIYETRGSALFTVLDENHAWAFQFLDAGMQKVYTALIRTSDGGDTWSLLLDPYTDATIQSFDKTGSVFINADYGWLTRDFRGVTPFLHLNETRDGGITWEALDIPTPPSLPDIFNNGACGLYNPDLRSTEQGSFRLSCLYIENDQSLERDFLYKTSDGGATWDILDAPGGKIFYISESIMYALARDIYRSDDGGQHWQYIKSVNWDGQFDFINQNTAWVVASDKSDWENPEYALVKTTDGCNSFSIIIPEVITSSTNR